MVNILPEAKVFADQLRNEIALLYADEPVKEH